MRQTTLAPPDRRFSPLLALALLLTSVVTVLAARPPVASAAGTTCPRHATPTGYVKAENARRGTERWKLGPFPRRSGLEAYADRVSALCGDRVTVYVSSRARSAHLFAYRMGYYNGAGARLVFRSDRFPTTTQSAPVVDETTHTARAAWRPTLRFRVNGRFTPGSYLLKIVDGRGGQTYVPLTITDPQSRAPLALMSEPMTWQAYNGWGGASAYYDAGHDPANRARVVSFDRPYDHNVGSGTFFHDEYPLLRATERAGLDINYVTDVDVHRNPRLLRRYRGVLLGSHSEYWSHEIRNGFEAARDHGVNLAFFGANLAYWQVRMGSSPLGPDRSMTVYKNATEDPSTTSDPQLATVRWREAPVVRPESTLLGQQYECYGIKADMVLSSPAWPFKVQPGTRLKDVVLGEYDRAGTSPAPARLQVLATSPLTCKGSDTVANVTYYTATSGAGVFSAGTLGWVCHMNGSCPGSDVRATGLAKQVLTQTTLRLARAMRRGPLGTRHPSTASAPPPPPTPALGTVGEDADAATTGTS